MDLEFTITREQSQPAAPAYAPAATPGAVSWFYCQQPAGYYPYVQSCTKPWVRVVPNATQPQAYQPPQG